MRLTFYRQIKHCIPAEVFNKNVGLYYIINNLQFPGYEYKNLVCILNQIIALGLEYFKWSNFTILYRKKNEQFVKWFGTNTLCVHGTDTRHWILLRCYMWIFPWFEFLIKLLSLGQQLFADLN